jgi:hypothetical protein
VGARYRVEKKDHLDGSSTWHVVDANQDGQPAAEFDDEGSARAHADRLEAEDDATPDTGGGEGGGDVPPTVP